MSKHNRERRTFRQALMKMFHRVTNAYEAARTGGKGRKRLSGMCWNPAPVTSKKGK